MGNPTRFLLAFVVVFVALPQISSYLHSGGRLAKYFKDGVCIAKETVKYSFNYGLIGRFALTVTNEDDKKTLDDLKTNFNNEIDNAFETVDGPAVIAESSAIYARYLTQLTRFVSSSTTIDAVFKNWVTQGLNMTAEGEAIENAFRKCWPPTLDN